MRDPLDSSAQIGYTVDAYHNDARVQLARQRAAILAQPHPRVVIGPGWRLFVVQCGRSDVDNVARAICCNPVPGDEITGIRLSANRVVAHRGDCPRLHETITRENIVRLFWTTREEIEEQRQRNERRESLATMPYAEYLKTPEWEKRRRRAVMRAKRKCQLCGERDQVLHVHHNTYDSRGAEPACDLIVLCATCHKAYHSRQDVVGKPIWERRRYVESDYADHIKPQGRQQ